MKKLICVIHPWQSNLGDLPIKKILRFLEEQEYLIEIRINEDLESRILVWENYLAPTNKNEEIK